jgi:hypothetical protein
VVMASFVVVGAGRCELLCRVCTETSCDRQFGSLDRFVCCAVWRCGVAGELLLLLLFT